MLCGGRIEVREEEVVVREVGGVYRGLYVACT